MRAQTPPAGEGSRSGRAEHAPDVHGPRLPGVRVIEHVPDSRGTARGDRTALEALDLAENEVESVAPLAGLSSLAVLVLSKNLVTDLAPLAKLEKLEMLQMKRTRVTDLSPLKGLKKLKNLYIEGSAVTDWSMMNGIPGLKVHGG